ncbi:MAG: hypothetical protein ACI4AL_12700 [Aristaeellaceae bacterium]
MNGMIRKLRRSALLLLIALLCLACGLSEEVQLNDMSAYADRVQEELTYFQETYAESDGWKAGAVLLDEAEYGWIGEARELLNRYFMDAYGLDISRRTAGIEVYASENLPEVVDGFSDGENHVYFNRGEIERVPERMLHILTHEMLHALGVDFYADENGMLSNGFFEGLTEAATKRILESCGSDYEDFSGYDEVRIYGEQALQADPMLLLDLVEGSERNIAHRIDARVGEGWGQVLLECELLLSTGPDAAEIGENCTLILQRYAESMAAGEDVSTH